MQLTWMDVDKTTVIRNLGDGVRQFIPIDSPTYREEILPMVASGNEIAPFSPPSPPRSEPNYPGFRAAIAMAPEYERILDAIASISPTRQASIIQVWGKVEDSESLQLAIGFWNLRVVPDAAIAPEEAQVLQNLAVMFKIPIQVADNGQITVIS